MWLNFEHKLPLFVTHFFHSLIILIITDYPDPDKRTSSRIRTKRTSSGIQIHITSPNICKHKYMFTEALAFNWIPIFKINLHTLRIFFTLPIRCFLLLDFFFKFESQLHNCEPSRSVALFFPLQQAYYSLIRNRLIKVPDRWVTW